MAYYSTFLLGFNVAVILLSAMLGFANWGGIVGLCCALVGLLLAQKAA